MKNSEDDSSSTNTVGNETQLSLTPAGGEGERPTQLGRASVEYKDTQSILTPASGFMADYDYTLNPYNGCGFGCTYCYAAFFSRDQVRQDTWGQWVEVKANALSVLRRMRTPLLGKSIYMSSVTDPYQPIERRLELVRDLLRELAVQKPRLVIQTRSPLVTRDLDLFRQFDHLRVNMTVTTDAESVRKAFEPSCPSNARRLSAIRELAAAGIECAITVTPLLPVDDVASFADQLVSTGVERFVVQPFHAERGRFVAGTREAAVQELERRSWSADDYQRTVDALKARLPIVLEGREGFAPV